MKVIIYFIQDYHYILALLLFVFAAVVVKDHYIYIWFSVLQSPDAVTGLLSKMSPHRNKGRPASWGTQVKMFFFTSSLSISDSLQIKIIQAYYYCGSPFSLLIASASILLHMAAYGFICTTIVLANALPSSAALVKS